MADERIEVTGGPAAGLDTGVEGDLIIGRNVEGFGALGGDPEISRRHAQILRTPEGRLYVADLGSTNGTFVNGERISGSAWLSPGDVIRAGRSTLKVTGGATGGETVIKPTGGGSPTVVPGAAAAGAAAGAAGAGAAADEAAAAEPTPVEPPGPSEPTAPEPTAPEPVAPSPPPAVAPTPAAAAPGPPGPPPGAVPSGPPGPPPGAVPGPGPGGLPPSGPGPSAPPPSDGGGRNRGLLIGGIIGGVVLLLILAGVGLVAGGAFDEEEEPRPNPVSVPTTPTVPTVPSVPTTPPTTTTEPDSDSAGRAVYLIGFNRIQGSYARQVRALVRRFRSTSSVDQIITAFKRIKGLYGSTATRINDLDTPADIRATSRAYTSTLRTSSAGINLIIACARQRSQSCYTRRVRSLSGRTRRIRQRYKRAYRSRDYPVVIAAPS